MSADAPARRRVVDPATRPARASSSGPVWACARERTEPAIANSPEGRAIKGPERERHEPDYLDPHRDDRR